MQRTIRRPFVAIMLTVAVVAGLLLGLPAFAADPGDNGYVTGTGGDGLNLRATPSLSAQVYAVMPEGASIEVIETGLSGDGLTWWHISYGGLAGYSSAEYLNSGDSGDGNPSEVPQPDTDPTPTTGVTPGAWATVTGTGGDGVNVRDEPSTDGLVIAGAPEGAAVWVLDGPVVDWSGAAWYQVDANGVGGWIYGLYLAGPDGGVGVGDGGSSEPIPTDIPPSDEVGSAIVSEALKYYGTEYLWAGTTPAGFDCSGFTYYIVNQVLGNDFPRALEEQYVTGEFIPADQLIPGDLVFFADTYKPGLSHVGFYIGNGQFLSAGGEEDVVAADDLWSSYWDARYMGARRVR